ncbi:MAG: two component transcriptional regulator, winged helix family [Acidimicrobiales bacterium]|nr:two component transcriptional regulator, winged helix family [Acidimicrobiales bacterium]
MRVLVVEDEPKMADVLRRALQRDGHAVDVAGDGNEALWFAGSVAFDAIVLDAMIPAPDGFEVCRRLRGTECWVPILMLTARDAVADRVAGLDAGADDYLTKPFSLVELLARLRAITRREPAVRPVVLSVGGLRLDPATHQVSRDGTGIELSPKEFALLQHFMRHPGEALSRSDIIEHVWDFAYDGTSNVVDVYVHYLRDRIDRPFGTNDLQTVVGVGYRLAMPVTA